MTSNLTPPQPPPLVTSSADLITFDRIDLKPDSTRSRILIRGLDSGFKGLEDIVKDGPKVHGERAIPAGRYPLGFYESPKFRKSYYTLDDVNLIDRKVWETFSERQRNQYHPHDLIWVKNVPNYQYILLHWGNAAFDTDGCGLIGSAFGFVGKNTAIVDSRKAYVKFYAKVAPQIRLGNQFITYRNSFAA